MRIAIVSDIHGNRTAFEAALADLRQTSPDLILHGGDLADCGSSPVEIVDRIRDFGWHGVMGNTDEMLVRPESMEEFASRSSASPSLWAAIRRMAEATRNTLGEERLTWLGGLPAVQTQAPLALVHASPDNCWLVPKSEATDELQAVYGPLGQPLVAHGHTHRPSVRSLPGLPEFLVDTGSVGLSYDGDPRAAYLLVTNGIPLIQRVAYDIDKELEALSFSGLPYADWIAIMLRTSSPQLPTVVE
jgi:predicted phosphodiesterase